MMTKVVGWLKQHSLLAGFILMFLFTWPLDLAAAAQSHGWLDLDILPVLAIFVGYGFVAAALVMTAIISGKAGVIALLRRFLIWRVGWGWYVVVLLGPLLLGLLKIGLQALLEQTSPDFAHPMALNILGPEINLWAAAPLFLIWDALANGEEIGWRGYALPRLQARYNALISSLIIGVIWAIWHLPKSLMAGSAETPFSFGLSVLGLMATAVLFTWIYNSTGGSLLLVTLFHAAGNTAWLFLPTLSDGLIDVALSWLVAIIVILLAGPITLAGRKPAPVELDEPTLPVGAAMQVN
jgi:membrane protease YdiL (CAAX protease family)